MHSFKELKVWKAAISLSKTIFEITKTFPQSERFSLTTQMTRAAVSVPSNIAEGCGRKSDKELHYFLSIALGSSFELETQLILAKEFNYLSDKTLQTTGMQITEVQKMLYGFQKSLKPS